ncbi:MAG: hypothetical protein ACFCD0_15665 [Gemmataceae bacterium]
MRILCSRCQNWIPVASQSRGRMACPICGTPNVLPSQRAPSQVKPMEVRPVPSPSDEIRGGRPPQKPPESPSVARGIGNSSGTKFGFRLHLAAAVGFVVLTSGVCGLIIFLRSGTPIPTPSANDITQVAQQPNEEQSTPPTRPDDPQLARPFSIPWQQPKSQQRLNPRQKSDPRKTQAAPNPKKRSSIGVGQQIVNFLGAQAQGRRFCIIADYSKSMEERLSKADQQSAFIKIEGATYRRNLMGYLQKELTDTLRSIQPQNNFYVLFFSTKTKHMPVRKWLNGGKSAETVIRWANEIKPFARTRPYGAFKAAFALEPRPDVIFFMTDGLIPPDTASKVAKLNDGQRKVRIYTIQLISKAASLSPTKVRGFQAQMKQIANESGGLYRETIAEFR